MKKVILLLVLCLTIGTTAQDKKQDGYFGPSDYSENSRPFIQLDYGISFFRHKKFPPEFNYPGIGEIKVGYTHLSEHKSKTIMEMRDNFLFAGNQSTDLSIKTVNGLKVKPEGWRFGVGFKDALGYRINNFYILPYTQMSLFWTNAKIKLPDIVQYSNDPVITKSVNDIAGRYNGDFKFGTIAEGGIDFRFGSMVSIIPSFETGVIFPKHLVWKQMGSFMMEEMGVVAIDYFVEEVVSSSPIAAPIVNFLLKNGFTYAFYQLKRDKMNWPFESEAPLTYESFKIGLKFSF